jgi:hypothetical protein
LISIRPNEEHTSTLIRIAATCSMNQIRRLLLFVTLGLIAHLGRASAEASPQLTLAPFSADVTVPLGHALMGGGILPAQEVIDPLFARGLILDDGFLPVVIVAVDWCEIRNDAYDAWQRELAAAVGTIPARVMVMSLHQHDTPVADLTAEKFLRDRQLAGSVCDPEFHAQAVARVAEAARAARSQAVPITHIGTGQGRAEQLASNRRYPLADGQIVFDRTSASGSERAHQAPEGTIDPWVKTLSFWNQDQPVAAISAYAIHPMSYYGKGGVSSDFVGLARRLRGEAEPGVFQIYVSGCSGNVTAGKYNDGHPSNRPRLAERLAQAMQRAWQDTQRQPLTQFEFRAVPLFLPPRASSGFTTPELLAQLVPDQRPFAQCLAAMGLSYRQRYDAGQPILISALHLGSAAFVLLPGESYVEFQLHAQQLSPDRFTLVAGYGESATGYVPIERAWQENDTNLRDWCWVDPGAESRLKQAVHQALASP